MSIVGRSQDLWITGSRFYFLRDGTDRVVDLGRIEPAAPTLAIERVELFDSDGGIRRRLAQNVTQINESYSITCSNFATTNLALLYLAEEAAAYAQSAGTVGPIEYEVDEGGLVFLVDGTGQRLFNITAITAVTDDTAPTPVDYDENDDWEIYSADRGILRVVPGGAITGLAQTIRVTATVPSIVGNRLLNPQTTRGAIEGIGEIWFSQDNFAQQTVRRARMSITPGTPTLSDTDYSSIVFEVAVLSDILETNPAGSLIRSKGALPALS